MSKDSNVSVSSLEIKDPVEQVCSVFWKLYDKKALSEAIKRGYVGVEYFKRLIQEGADWKAPVLQNAYSPVLLELLRRAGVNLRFRNDILVTEIVKKKLWDSLHYLFTYGNVPIDVNLFVTAFESRDVSLLNVLLSCSSNSPGLWSGPAGEALCQSDWWEGIHLVSLSPHFTNVIRETALFKSACLAGAKNLVCSILLRHTFETEPFFSKSEIEKMEPLIAFSIKQFLRVIDTQVQSVPEAAQQEALPPPPLQPLVFQPPMFVE